MEIESLLCLRLGGRFGDVGHREFGGVIGSFLVALGGRFSMYIRRVYQNYLLNRISGGIASTEYVAKWNGIAKSSSRERSRGRYKDMLLLLSALSSQLATDPRIDLCALNFPAKSLV
jgi:hypothetical protein